VVVRYCALKNGISHFDDYVILGDDIVIAHTGVADTYVKFIRKSLGMEISMSKSVVGIGCAEFTKNLYLNGTNFSPIPASTIHSLSKFPKLLVTLFVDLSRR